MFPNGTALIANSSSGIALEVTKSPLVEDYIAIEVRRLLEDVRSALNCDLGIAKRSAARLATLLADKVTHDVRSVPARGGLAPWQKRKLQLFIESGLEGPLPIEELANLVSLSSSYFCRAFKESFGEPPHAYVIKMRIERAKALMLNTSESLSQIAVACGLVDQAHLCRCFRHVMGMTPGVWRRIHATGPKTAVRMAIADRASPGSDRYSFLGEVAVSSRTAALPS